MNQNYQNYLKTPKAKLGNFSIGTKLLPHPHKYGCGPARRFPTNRVIIAKESILTFEHYMANLNVFKCLVYLEYEIQAKLFDQSPNYICPLCTNRKDPNYYTDNKLHPVWYFVVDDGNYVLDANTLEPESGGISVD